MVTEVGDGLLLVRSLHLTRPVSSCQGMYTVDISTATIHTLDRVTCALRNLSVVFAHYPAPESARGVVPSHCVEHVAIHSQPQRGLPHVGLGSPLLPCYILHRGRGGGKQRGTPFIVTIVVQFLLSHSRQGLTVRTVLNKKHGAVSLRTTWLRYA